MNFDQLVFSMMDSFRGELKISEFKRISVPVFSLKYLESKNLIPQETTLNEVLKRDTDIEKYLLNAFAVVENQIPSLRRIYGIYPSKQVSQATLFNFLLKVNNLRLSDDEWGDLAEHLFNRFYESEGKQDGSLYSPKGINQLGTALLDPKEGTFYDGTLGMGGTAVAALNYAEENGGKLTFYGQEVNVQSWALAKFRLLFHGYIDVQIIQGDTLLEPAFVEKNSVTKFDYVMMDFPFSMNMQGYDEILNKHYHRFVYGLPTKRNADMAFIMHALASLKSDGKAVVVVTNGTLFRAGAEKQIRQNMIDADVIEAVVALPDNIYAETGIPVNLLVLNKNKLSERRNKILFINAENEFTTNNRRKYIESEHVDKIVSAFKSGLEVKNFSTLLPIEQIEDADLLVKRYLSQAEINDDLFGTVNFLRKEIENNSINQHLSKLTHDIFRGMNASPQTVNEGEGEYQIIKLSDLQEGEINLRELTFVSMKRNTKVNMYLVQEGDVIVSSRGAHIKIAVIPENQGNIILSHNFIGIRCKNELDPYFLKAYLESPVGQYLLTARQIGTNILTINPSDLKDILIPLPELKKQKEISQNFKRVQLQHQEAIRQAEEKKKQRMLQLYDQMGILSAMKIKH